MSFLSSLFGKSKPEPEFPSIVDYNIILESEVVSGIPVRRVDIGLLNVPTGEMICSDAIAIPEQFPFTRRVPKGKYPVSLYFADMPEAGPRVALAKLEISAVRVEKWILALKTNDDVSKLTESGAYFGFPVDAGIGCFWDKKTCDAYLAKDNELYKTHKENIYDLYLEAELKKSAGHPADPHDAGDWANFTLPGTDLNVTMFSSGYGDGRYPSYWGVDGNGKLVSLVIDFMVLPDLDNEQEQ